MAAVETLDLVDGHVDLDARRVIRGGQEARLSRSEAEVLRRLAASPRSDVPRELLLHEVLGVSPRVVTRALDHLVARLRKKIEIDPADPRHVITAHGVGYRFVPAPRTSLPRVPRALVGRAREIDAIRSALDRGATLLTLVGGAGVGKTRLAVEVARQLREEGRRTAYVDLCVCRTAADVVGALARSLGASPDDLADALLAGADMLLVLDNAEHLLPDLAPELERVLAVAASARWLVTSREPLRVALEERLDVGPLAPPEARSLFVERAAAVGVAVDAASPALARVCDLLEGRPLAVELAAGRLPALGLDGVLSALAQPLELLRASGHDATGRHASMERALLWSWNELGAPARAALVAVSRFCGDFTLDDARAVIARDDAIELLERLVECSLIERREHGESRRFHVSWVVRELATKLGTPEEIERARLRHARRVVVAGPHEHVHELLQVAAGDSPLAAEAALLAAEEYEHELGADACLALVDALATVQLDRGLELRRRLVLASATTVRGELDAALEHVAQAAQLAGADAERARVELARARANRHRAPDVARSAADTARDLATRADASALVMAALQILGALARERGQHNDAREHLQSGLLLAERLGDPFAESGLCIELGTTLLESGLLREAARAYERAMRIDRAIGAEAREALAASNLAVVEHLEGELEQARSRQRLALSVHRRVGNRRLVGFSLGALAVLAFERGELADAERLLMEAEMTVAGVDPLVHSYVLVGLALVWADLGDAPRAADAMTRASRAFAGRNDGRDRALQLIAAVPERGEEPAPLDAFSRLALRLVRARRARGR